MLLRAQHVPADMPDNQHAWLLLQVPAQPSVYLAQVALPAQCQGTVTVDVLGTFSSNRAAGPQVLSEPVSGVSFEKTSVAPALETQAVSIFTAFTQS